MHAHVLTYNHKHICKSKSSWGVQKLRYCGRKIKGRKKRERGWGRDVLGGRSRVSGNRGIKFMRTKWRDGKRHDRT